MRLLLLPALAVLSLSATAQDDSPRFRIALGLAGGEFEFSTDSSTLDDRTDAGMFRLEFEATSARGIGGGVRLESVATDDDLFVANGQPASEAGNGSLYGHFTYRLTSHRFAMPIRAGLLFNGLTLQENVSNDEVQYASVGPYFEVAPEFTLIRSGRTQWTLYGQFGFGGGYTAIDIDNDGNDYESSTGFAGLELGTRLYVSAIELGLAYVGRWQSMDESDPENGLVVLGYDASFHGLMFQFGVNF